MSLHETRLRQARWAGWASLVGNIVIVVTGGAVRLTGSGLGCPTWPRCTEENFTVKAGAQRYAAELGLVVIAPDTSPRGPNVADDPAYDLGQGAGFYVDATESPWAPHFRMYSYVAEELPALIADKFPLRPGALGIMGHSMGGHGALVLGLREPTKFASVSVHI